MTWAKVDDKLTLSEKWLAAGTAGQALWINALSKCAGQNSDGVISSLTAMYAAQCAGVTVEEAGARLVQVGLWHDAKSLRKCEKCRETVKLLSVKRLPVDGFYFHDWFDQNPSKDEAKNPVERFKFNRKKALHRNPALKQAIVERDGTICQYCGERVDFKNHGPRGGTYDHIDPDGPNALWNLVVACNHCNVVLKGERTPEEADMPLLNDPRLPRRIPAADREHSQNAARIAPLDTGNAASIASPESENASRDASAHARLGGGPGRTGNIPGLGSERAGDGSGRIGPVLAGAGGDSDGSGRASAADGDEPRTGAIA